MPAARLRAVDCGCFRMCFERSPASKEAAAGVPDQRKNVEAAGQF